MKAFILAAGKGTRLRPLTEKIPKVMFKIDGKPVLEHNLNLLKKAGVEEVWINLHYLSSKITNYFRNGSHFGMKIRYSQEKKLLGSAGAIKKQESEFSEPFYLIYGDNFSNCDLLKLRQVHFKNKGIATIVLFDIKKNKNSGIGTGRVIYNKKTKRIISFAEGGLPESNLVNAGIYILEPEIFKHIPKNKFYDFGKDLFPALLKKGEKLIGYLMPKNEFLCGIDNFDCLNQTKKLLKTKIKL